jgi:hypothetical protein
METAFKFLLFFGVLLYSLIVIGVFLLIIRIALSFGSPVYLMGFTIS